MGRACVHHVGYSNEWESTEKIVPTDGAKLLMHSFRLMTWHASDLIASGLDTCTRRKTRRLKGGRG
jgi:hypothetical protein